MRSTAAPRARNALTVPGVGWPYELSSPDGLRPSRRTRKNYLPMLEDVKSGHIDAVVSWHPDRLYRQPAELEDLITIVEEHKTEITTVKAGDLGLSTPTGLLMARMLGAIAKYEVEHKQERILRKVLELVAEGKIHNSGHRPFGYTRLFDGEGPRRKILGDIVSEEEALGQALGSSGLEGREAVQLGPGLLREWCEDLHGR
ncbi:recombinase family protein [Streptomyces werraensis]|uniref:recombinase family protein n=1 Tax=Streptomyces werraensis TaxID=68284 RepID=UPI0034387E5E